MRGKNSFPLNIIEISYFYDNHVAAELKKNFHWRGFLRQKGTDNAINATKKRAGKRAEAAPLPTGVCWRDLFLDQARADIFKTGLQASFVI